MLNRNILGRADLRSVQERSRGLHQPKRYFANHNDLVYLLEEDVKKMCFMPNSGSIDNRCGHQSHF